MHFRFLPLLLATVAILLAPCLAQAQQQERKLEERIMRPDMTLGAKEQTQAFNGGKYFSTTSTSASKSFTPSHPFFLKKFFTRSFTGEKANSASQSRFNLWQKPGSNLTKAASTQDAGKVFATSAVAVNDAKGLDKKYSSSSDKFQTAQGKWEGKSQKSIDLQQQQKPMSIDEVRDLLNKNK